MTAKVNLCLLIILALLTAPGCFKSSEAQLKQPTGYTKNPTIENTNEAPHNDPVLTAKSQPKAQVQTQVQTQAQAQVQAQVQAPAPLAAKPASELSCEGIAKQGGVVICRTRPKAKVKIGRGQKDYYFEQADADGVIIIGFDRDEKHAIISTVNGSAIEYDFTPRKYDISRIDGLPPSQVSTFTDAQLKKIRESSARKKIGFASRSENIGLKNGFILPIKDYIKTTNFGAQRVLNGEPKKPHYGVDMAAPMGTKIYAPADGIVSFADDDLYFEGALLLIDHGQGLISMYLHVNDILVEPGEHVVQGQPIATVGSKGRSTGPHLCWRLKWRNRNLDPELLTHWAKDSGVTH